MSKPIVKICSPVSKMKASQAIRDWQQVCHAKNCNIFIIYRTETYNHLRECHFQSSCAVTIYCIVFSTSFVLSFRLSSHCEVERSQEKVQPRRLRKNGRVWFDRTFLVPEKETDTMARCRSWGDTE